MNNSERHFVDGISKSKKSIKITKGFYILIHIALKLDEIGSVGPTDNRLILFQVMTWCQTISAVNNTICHSEFTWLWPFTLSCYIDSCRIERQITIWISCRKEKYDNSRICLSGNSAVSSTACLASQHRTSNGSWCMGIKGEMSGTVCVTFTWDMYIYMSCL